MAWESAVTKAGVALLNKWATGGTLTIDRAAAGTGFVNSDELANQTQLAQEKHTVSIVDKKDLDEGAQIKVSIQAAEEGYNLNQIGIFGKLDQGESTLIALYQNKDGIAIPSTLEMAEFVYEFYALLKISNDGEMQIVYDPNAYITNKTLLEVEERLQGIVNEAESNAQAEESRLQEIVESAKTDAAEAASESQKALQEIVDGAKKDAAEAKTSLQGIVSDAENDMNSLLDRARLPVITLTLPVQGWSATLQGSGLQSITIEAQGIAVSGNTAYFADLVQSGSEESDEIARSGWTQITRMVAGDGQVTVYALEVPETPIQTQIVALEVKEGTGIAEIMILRRGGTGVNSKDISKAVVTLDHDSFVYDESEHSPVVTQVTLRGNQLETPRDYIPLYVPATNVGGYSIVILGVREYGGVVEAPWSITQAAGSVSLSSDTLTVKGVMGTVNSSVTVTRKGTGAITAESLSPANATAEIINGNTVKVTSVKAGQAKIKIKVAETTNYAAAETELTVTVEKATGSISVQPTEITIQGVKGTTAEVTLQVTGDGTVTVDTSRYVTTQITGNKLKLTSVEAGSQTLNIKLAETENYTGASCTLAVEVQFASKTLNDNSWETIAGIAASGKAQEFWQVGDEKEITINGETYHVQIIGFDHDDLDSSDSKYSDSSYNGGKKKAAITFQMKECLTQTYRMDETSSNSCSWRDSEMRVTTFPKIKATFDPAAVAVMRTVTKKTGQSQTDSTLLSTPDELFLLCQREVFGDDYRAQPGEGTQYAFYAAANDKIKKNLTGSAVWWWLRSPSTGGSYAFRDVGNDGTTNYANATYGGSVAAGFCV